jgi:hypothetical protein
MLSDILISSNPIPQTDLAHKNKEWMFEQYKLLIDAIGRNHLLRETANNYWTTVNAVGTSASAYLLDSSLLNQAQRPVVIWALIMLGIFLSLSWLSFLDALKQDTEAKQSLLATIEVQFPYQIFSADLKTHAPATHTSHEMPTLKYSLTLREMMIPGIFLIGYGSFAVYLIWNYFL